MTKANPRQQYNPATERLHVALELSESKWLLAIAPGLGQKPLRRAIAPGDAGGLRRALEAARKRFGAPDGTPAVSCHEAGRDGFWVHRWLESEGVDNLVVDSSSIEVNRRRRRAKSDGIDAGALLRMLVRFHLGEKKVFSTVRVPTPEQEDARHLHRRLKTLKGSRTRAVNQIRGLLATQGVRPERIGPDLRRRLGRLRDWRGRPLGPGLLQRVDGSCRHLEWLQAEIDGIEEQRRKLLRGSDRGEVRAVRRLMGLKAVGLQSSWILEHEVFAWREIENGKQLGGLVGMVPTPWQSGAAGREQGISKSGNRWVRSVAVELAWMWVRYQPDSPLTRWFERRFADGGPRARKVGIVALARRLLIQLWQFRRHGIVPPGAVFKSEVRF